MLYFSLCKQSQRNAVETVCNDIERTDKSDRPIPDISC